MGRVASLSSLCLDCKKEKEEQKTGGVNKVGCKKKKKRKKEKILKVIYLPLGNRMRSYLSLSASCSASRGSICRWPRSSKLGLTGRLKPSRTLLTRCGNVYHFNLLLPTWRIFTSMPVPPFFLLVPFKDGRWVLFLGIC